MTISTITISTVNYTAYASVAEADPYLAVDPVRAAAWAALTTDQKGGYLVAATRRLDLLNWMGTKTGDEGTQVNAWPRTSVSYEDGTAVSTTEVPPEVENATILLAGSIARTNSVADAGTSGSNKKRLKAGSAEIEYFKPTSGVALQDETVWGLVKQFLDGLRVSTATGGYASGTGGTSSFEDNDYLGYGLGDSYS